MTPSDSLPDKPENSPKRNGAITPQQAENIRAALDVISAIVVSLNHNGEIIFCNQAFIHSTGFSSEELIGKNWNDLLIRKSDRPVGSSAELLNSLRENRKRKIISKSGEARSIRFTAALNSQDEDNRQGVTLIGEDVTESRKIIRALRETNSQLQDFFDSANDLIALFDMDGSILFGNRAWKEALQYDIHSAKPLKLKDIIHPDHYASAQQYLRNLLNGAKDEQFETVFITRNGQSINVIGSVNVRFEKGTPIAFRGIFHDNTEHLRAERAQNLYYKIASLAINSDNLEALCYNIHQELNTLIQVNNFQVALYDKSEDFLYFPYYVDENLGGRTTNTKRPIGRGLTEYTLFNEKSVFLYEEDIMLLGHDKKVDIIGAVPKIWLGVPLIAENRTIGVIAVNSHKDRNKYNKKHLELLDFISGQIALVIERKRKEEKIVEQTARLNSIFESSSHLIWSVNRRMGLTSFNHNYAEVIYRKYHEYPDLDKGTHNPKKLTFSNPEYNDFVAERYKEAFKGNPQHYETRYTSYDGHDIWRETFLNPIFLPDGRIEEVSGISHDITEQKQWELTLQESEEKFRNIFESFLDIYYRTDIYGKITMISPSGLELSGYTEDELIGKHVTNFFVNPYRQVTLIRELIETGRVRNYESNLVLKNGSVIQTISNIRLINNKEGKPVAVEGVIRDISSLKEASEEILKAKELAEKSLKVKESFLANMSHEIRTPMNGIIGMIDLLTETSLNAEQHAYVNTIKRSSETLLDILNDILDLSKIEAGKMQLRPVPVYLEGTIEKLYNLFNQQANSKGIELIYTVDSNVPRYILADETRLLQILSNLTSNAIKFTDHGFVKVGVSLKKRDNAKLTLHFSIRDTGIGISKENLKLLFESFSQVDTSSTKKYAGTGLGLSISRELTRLMSGKIGVETEAGEGSVFWFTIQTEETNTVPVTAEKIRQQQVSIEDTFTDKNPYVLLVDDNNINIFVAREILVKSGCKVDTAENGEKSIEMVKKNEYDLIFMDIQMPVMDGLTASKHIKALGKKHTPPIVAMTAYSMKEDREKFISGGMDDYISKPITSEKLIAKVVEWVSDKGVLKSEGPDKAETAVDNSSLLLDKSVVQKLLSFSDRETIVDIFQQFEIETEEQLEACKKSAQDNDLKNILNNLHTLKGSAGTLGAQQLSMLAKSAETRLKQNDSSQLEEDLQLLYQAFDKFRQTYMELIRTF